MNKQRIIDSMEWMISNGTFIKNYTVSSQREATNRIDEAFAVLEELKKEKENE